MTGRFLRCERASAAIEGAIAIFVLVSAFAGLMEIVNTVYTEDRMGRGARTVARALALNPDAKPWEVLGTEIDLASTATCPGFKWTDTGDDRSTRAKCVSGVDSNGDDVTVDCECDGWTMDIDRGVSPGTLATVLGGGTTPDGEPNGEMILVRLLKSRDPWSFQDVVPAAQAAPQPAPSTQAPQSVQTSTSQTAQSTPDAQSGNTDTSKSELVEMVAIGLARSEPEG